MSRLLTTAALLLLLAPAAPRAQEASPQVERLLVELRERDATLARRERDLAERERSIVALESRVEARLDELRDIQAIIEARIEDWEGQDGARIRRLARVYGEMPPERAAPLLESLALDLATSIVSSMKAKDSAKVLAVMNPEQALHLSRRAARPLDPGADEEAER